MARIELNLESVTRMVRRGVSVVQDEFFWSMSAKKSWYSRQSWKDFSNHTKKSSGRSRKEEKERVIFPGRSKNRAEYVDEVGTGRRSSLADLVS